jgi:HAD superfamily hydrolase (TIGR01509 family)
LLKAIIFDFDGVLGNTEHIQKRKWDLVLKPYNIEISDPEYGRLYSGKSSTSEIPGLLKAKYPQIPCSAEQLGRDAAAELKRLFPVSKIKLMPKTLELLRFVKERSLKMAVCSGKSPVELAMKLDKTGLSDWFPARYRITQADAGQKGKPDPGMCIIALERLEAAANESIVFEDTASGVMAAKNAGIKVVALPNYYSQEHNFAAADLVLRNGWPEVMENWEIVKGLIAI